MAENIHLSFSLRSFLLFSPEWGNGGAPSLLVLLNVSRLPKITMQCLDDPYHASSNRLIERDR